jgi:transcriptional regulator with XRE-family HTH domain
VVFPGGFGVHVGAGLPPVDLADVASWVRMRRRAALLTQEELAGLAAVSVRTIRNLEAGRGGRALTLRLVVAALAGALPPAEQSALRGAAPVQLPPGVRGFTGREALLRLLDRQLAPALRDSAAGTICVLSGPAGAGKTALAVHWGHRARGAFPDGQLYADLRGSVPGSQPPIAAVLAAFLRALGLPAAEVPSGVDERAARYRTLLTGRRTLVVLDDAASAEQIRLLLPGTPHCPVLATGRGRLAELVARHGAHRVEVGPLAPDSALRLLRALAAERAAADPQGAAALAERCGGLPLLLRTAAELAAAHPSVPLAELAADSALRPAGGEPPTPGA